MLTERTVQGWCVVQLSHCKAPALLRILTCGQTSAHGMRKLKGLTRSPLSAELYPVYVMAVSGCLFGAMLLGMRAPTGPCNTAEPTASSPFHLLNLQAVTLFKVGILEGCHNGSTTYQCSYCGEGWASRADSIHQRPKVRLLSPCRAAVPHRAYSGSLVNRMSNTTTHSYRMFWTGGIPLPLCCLT